MNNKNTLPPAWPIKLLKWFLNPDYLEEIEGDMEERYQDNLNRYSVKKARRLYTWDTLKLFRPILMKDLGGSYKLNHYGMFKHQVKLVWRQTINQKLFSTIKIGGFAIGIAACILIALYVQHQLSYDKGYKHQDQIYRVVNSWNDAGKMGYWTNVHGPLKELLEDNIPDMDKVARVVLWSWGDAGQNYIRKEGSEINTFEEGFFYADPELLDILEIEMVYGSGKDPLMTPNSLVISESKAQQYFKDQNPIGQTLILNDDLENAYVIGGVMKDFPSNSHLQGDFILTLYERKQGPGTSGWCCTNYDLYTRLVPMANKVHVEEKLLSLRDTYIMDKLEEQGESGLDEMQAYQAYYLQPVGDIYLNPERVGDNLSHGSIELVWIFSIIAVIILFLGCINFINLAIAKSLNRAKEVGLRKVFGSYRSNLIFQYLVESGLYTLGAILLGTLLASFAIIPFNQIAGTNISMPWLTGWFIPSLFSLALIIGIISGLYPALYLSAFQPIDALRKLKTGSGKVSIARNGLIVFQFTITVILIVSALVIHSQFEFLMNKSLGYEKEQLISIPGLETMDKEQKLAFKNELLNLSSVNNATISDYFPVAGGKIQNRSYWIADRRDVDVNIEAARWVVDADYIETMEMKIIQGRNFNETALEEMSIIVNEQMVKDLALEDPIGVELIDMFDERYVIIGVVEDFYFQSLFSEVGPLAMVKGQGRSTLLARLNTSEMTPIISSIEQVWTKFKSGQSFRFNFIDQKFEAMYTQLNQAKSVFILFSFLSIVIACSGIFALSVFLIGQRTKEISIRKILGASIPRIFIELSFDYMKLVLIAIIIAVPIAWYFTDFMLAEMANRINVNWYFFVLAGGMAFVITIATISYEAIKAALVNPADQLRNE